MRRVLLLLSLLLLAPAATGASAPRVPVSIFYYPWWGSPSVDGTYQHWQQNGHLPPTDISSDFYPARGTYSSDNPQVVDAQMAEIARTGAEEVVTSWWGWGSPTDARLPLIMRSAQAHGLSVAVQLEPYIGLTASTVAGDLPHFRDLGITRIYVYEPFETLTDADWSGLIAALPGVQMLAQTVDVKRAAADGFAGVYTYDIVRYGAGSLAGFCAKAHAAHLLCAPSVGPGFEADRATGDPHVKPRRDGKTYDAMWRAAIRSRPDRITITSYNEWHEGTQIEPASAAGSRLEASSPTQQFHYETYDGAWGLHGRAASHAYVDRTRYWVGIYRKTSAEQP